MLSKYSTWRISPWRQAEAKKLFENLSPHFCRFLEAGCAEGYILNKVKADEKYGFDFDAKRIAEARKKYPCINFTVQNAEKTNYKKEFFDGLICFHLLEHVPNPENAVSECARILKKNGQAVFAVPCERIKGDTTLNPEEHLHKFKNAEFSGLLDRYFKIEKAFFNTLVPSVFKEIKNTRQYSLIYNLSYSMMFFYRK